MAAIEALNERSSKGKYEVKMQIRVTPKQEEIFEIDAPSSADAITEATSKAVAKYKNKTGYKVADIKHISAKTLREPPKDNAVKDIAGADALDKLSLSIESMTTSSELKELVAGLKKIQSLIQKLNIQKYIDKVDDFGKDIPDSVNKKLGIAGKALTFKDILLNVLKIIECVFNYGKTTSKSVKNDYIHDIIILTGSISKSIAGMANPIIGLVDLGYCLVDSACETAGQKVKDEKNTAKKAQYDNHKYALYQHEAWYESEWKMFANGVSMDDIVQMRKTRWKGHWDPDGRKKIFYTDPASDTGVYHNLQKFPFVKRK
ncbi:MAG: hypothetical protein LBG94_07370 [Treponema sp.]|nr:hypothetical protein [Treponema sp.]